MIRSLYYTPGKPLRKDIPAEEFPRLLRDRRSLLWVDFDGEPAASCLPILQAFNFHPLAIDDALAETHSPKLDDWGDYLYIALNYMHITEDDEIWGTTMDEV